MRAADLRLVSMFVFGAYPKQVKSREFLEHRARPIARKLRGRSTSCKHLAYQLGPNVGIHRAPVQVIDGNCERMSGVCPWWDRTRGHR